MNKKLKEIISYLIFGGLSTAVNIISFYILEKIFNWPYLYANALAISSSILFAYVTNKRFVFESHTDSFQATLREFLSFISFRLASGIIDMLSMWLLVELIHLTVMESKLLIQFIVIVLNYLFSKFYIFKSKPT